MAKRKATKRRAKVVKSEDSVITVTDNEPTVETTTAPVEVEKIKTPRELLADELKEVEAKIIEQMPTQYELKRGNSKTVEKIIRFETKFHPLVDRWRVIKKALGIKKTLDSMRPSGITIDAGQNVGRIK